MAELGDFLAMQQLTMQQHRGLLVRQSLHFRRRRHCHRQDFQWQSAQLSERLDPNEQIYVEILR